MTLLPRPAALLFVALAMVWFLMLLFGGPGSVQDLGILEAAAIADLAPAAGWLTILGGGAVLVPLSVAVSLAMAIRGEKRRAFVLLGMVLVGRLLVEVQKMAFDRARPDPAGHLVAVHSMAFPSGHAAGSMTAALGIALVCTADPGMRRGAITLAVLFAFLVGASRLVLGVHWPSDVIGGWTFGAAWTLALVRLAGADARRPAERQADSFIGGMKEKTDGQEE
ncbi:phosphatase PAP2 family protein [Sphingosinicella rhizophila]|uniref:Phosphatase PAP2 family protein n=1 Tax=Sphingosinicella rhizophila TaxID=3050082 RepID=A0ABU3Q5A6_9SPHN|nr:phosphatase PAP2 family protein [Sphingosinicella sp. GR2756]MDT9598472.1 phosphatase PAP2 family protein [Sphingosinicella sp. GR2756]